jgi:hypothetical protein
MIGGRRVREARARPTDGRSACCGQEQEVTEVDVIEKCIKFWK